MKKEIKTKHFNRKKEKNNFYLTQKKKNFAIENKKTKNKNKNKFLNIFFLYLQVYLVMLSINPKFLYVFLL